MRASRASAVRFRAEPRSSSISRASLARRGSRGGLRVPRASLTQLDQGVKNEIGKHGTRGSLLCRARGALPSRVTSARKRERKREDVTLAVAVSRSIPQDRGERGGERREFAVTAERSLRITVLLGAEPQRCSSTFAAFKL